MSKGSVLSDQRTTVLKIPKEELRTQKKTPTVVVHPPGEGAGGGIDYDKQTIDLDNRAKGFAHNLLSRSILNIGSASRNLHTPDHSPDKSSPARKSTVQFGEGSFIYSHRSSLGRQNKLSMSHQKLKHRGSIARRDSVFDIRDEDKIFDDEKFKTSVEWVRKLQNRKKDQQQKTLNRTASNFGTIYKSDHEGVRRIKQAQKMKHNLDLDRYQKSLITSVGDYLSKDSIRKLETRLLYVKKLADRVQKEEAIDSLFQRISDENEHSIKNLQEFMDKLNHIRDLVNVKGEKLPLIKYKK
jgi:hypothetical protein